MLYKSKSCFLTFINLPLWDGHSRSAAFWPWPCTLGLITCHRCRATNWSALVQAPRALRLASPWPFTLCPITCRCCPGDNGHQVPPIHILRQATRQESSSSIGSSRGPSQEFVRVESSGPLARVSIDSQSINRMPSLPGDSVHQVHSMCYRRQAFKDASCN